MEIHDKWQNIALWKPKLSQKSILTNDKDANVFFSDKYRNDSTKRSASFKRPSRISAQVNLKKFNKHPTLLTTVASFCVWEQGTYFCDNVTVTDSFRPNTESRKQLQQSIFFW